MKYTDKKFLEKIINKYSNSSNKENNYPLTSSPFETSDIIKGAETLIGGRITMSNITSKFESEFAKFLGVKYALMVNSGSSANLLAFFGLVNPKNKKKIRNNDECILPAICWSTSLWPIVQSGLKPVFIDVDLNTFNLNLDHLEKKINKRTKVILAVHILGNCANMNKLIKIINKKKITLIEDTCESLGSIYNNKYLGTFGRYGTYSFYVSHQMTAGEGGMIVCNNIEDYKIIHALRAHGWDRGLFKKNNRNFNFVNSGFNLRPLDLTAAIGLSQFKRLNKMNMKQLRRLVEQVVDEERKKSTRFTPHQTKLRESLRKARQLLEGEDPEKQDDPNVSETGFAIVNPTTNLADLDPSDAYQQLSSGNENMPLIKSMRGLKILRKFFLLGLIEQLL